MWNIGLTGNPSLIYIDKEKTFWIYINGKGVYSYREGQKNAVAVKEADERIAKAEVVRHEMNAAKESCWF